MSEDLGLFLDELLLSYIRVAGIFFVGGIALFNFTSLGKQFSIISSLRKGHGYLSLIFYGNYGLFSKFISSAGPSSTGVVHVNVKSPVNVKLPETPAIVRCLISLVASAV